MLAFVRTAIGKHLSYLSQQRKEKPVGGGKRVRPPAVGICDVAAHRLADRRLLQRLPYFNVGL